MDKIFELAEKYNAMVMIDESHSAGVVGKTGRGVTELFNIRGKAEIITGTLGKAFGGAIGGFTTGKMEIIDMLRQRSRPYLFSNTLAPAVTGATIAVLDMLSEGSDLFAKLRHNTSKFRSMMTDAGFEIKPGDHPIVPIMLHEDRLANVFADKLLDEGIYVIGFTFPVDKVRNGKR